MTNRIKQIALVFMLGFLTTACGTWNQPKSQTTEELISKAVRTLDEFHANPELEKFNGELLNAHAVVILPTVIKAGFFAGGEGGNGVLLKRQSTNSWGYPTFLSMGAASFGLQIGLQDTSIILIARNAGALEALLKHQGKIGADAGATLWTEGIGLEAAVTSNLGADLVAFANSSAGGYVGASLEGAVLITRHDLNEAFYGEGAEPRSIVAGQYQNPKADILRRALAKNQ